MSNKEATMKYRKLGKIQPGSKTPAGFERWTPTVVEETKESFFSEAAA